MTTMPTQLHRSSRYRLLAIMSGLALVTCTSWPAIAAEEDTGDVAVEQIESAESDASKDAGAQATADQEESVQAEATKEPAENIETVPACEYCRFESGASGFIEAGVIQVTDDNYKFGRHNGLDEEGSYLLLNGAWQNILEDGRRIDINLKNGGQDNRQAHATYSRQGSYSISAAYEAIPQAGYRGARTPFIEQNDYDNVLRLPSGWVDGNTTRNMPGLAPALRNEDLENMRRRTMAAMELGMLQDWDFNLQFSHEERDGTHLRGGSFLTSATQLAIPRDLITDTMEASVFYTGESLTMRFGYYLSLFSTTHEGISWENPFESLLPGADMGYMAVEPDNRFHQVSASIAYRMSPGTMLNVQAALGTGEQDNDYLPATSNALLGNIALPAAALDGEVETRTLHARLNSRLSRSVSLQANVRSDKRDNQSPELAFTQVVTDSYISGDATNRAYDITRKNYDVSGNFRPSSDFRLRAAVEKKDVSRNYMEVDETSENIAWIDTRVSAWDFASLRLKYLQSDRDGSRVIYDQPGGLAGGLEQNPLLRRFHVADRDRDSWQVALDIDPLPWMFITLASEINEDVYPESSIGLRESTVRTHSLDANFIASQSTRYAIFVNRDVERSRQAGSEGFAEPDWFATNKDKTWTFGFAANYEDIEKPWKLSMNLSVSEFAGASDVDTYTDVSPFPDLVAQMYRADLEFSYRLADKRQLTIGYVFEEYDFRNWQLDAAGVTSVPKLLSAGINSPNYSVSVLSVGYRWAF